MIKSNVAALLIEDVLRILAERLAATKPLRRCGGWRFGFDEQRLSAAGRARLRLWRLGKVGILRRPVRVRWYEGLELLVWLGNDLSRCVYVGGRYDPNELVFLSEVLRAGHVVIDAGANEGLYTVFAARRVGRAGRVVAVEPSRREFERLRRNVEHNRLDNVTVVRAALSDRDGFAELHIADVEHAGQNTLGRFMYPGVCEVGREAVKSLRLDRAVEELGLTRVDVIKMDIEGAEVSALRGAGLVLQRYRPVLLLEAAEQALAAQGASVSEMFELLAAFDYYVFEFDPVSGEPVPCKWSGGGEARNLVAVPGERREA